MTSESIMYLRRYGPAPNWGDAIAPYIFEKLSGVKPTIVGNGRTSPNDESVYQVTGSIMGWCCNKTEVWGCGIIRAKQPKIRRPRKIHAVRGPLTRDLVLKMGYKCPPVYGDPALLMPMFYNPVIKPTFKLGIVPHYIDAGNPWLTRLRKHPRINVINILSGREAFVNEILSCEVILSSSLHGLIVADAYGIPSLRIRLSNKVLGGDFKFTDYYKSIGHEHNAVTVKPNDLVKDVSVRARIHELRFDRDSLLEACPFNRLV